MFRLEVANTKSEWNSVLEKSENATVFHQWVWLKSFEKHSSFEFVPYVVYDAETPVGVFPVFIFRKYSLSFVFSPPPGSAMPFLGFVFSEYDNLKQNKKEKYVGGIFEAVNKTLVKTFFSTILAPGIKDVRPFLWGGYEISPVYHYTFDLSRGKDVLWAGLKKGLRKNIRKTEREVTIKNGGRRELEKILDLVERRYVEQGRKIKVPREYILDVYESFKENFQILTAEMQGDVVSGLINLLYRDKVYSWIGNTKTNIRGIYPNDLLIWESLSRAAENGYRKFYEIGANTPRLVKYKSTFNPDLELCFSITHKTLLATLLEKIYRSLR